MILNNLLIRNFRNYKEEKILFNPNLNIIYGKNAQGKTNLLEAIAYLSLASSFRQQKEDKILGWNRDFFYLEAEFQKNGETNFLTAGYNKKRRLWKKNQIPCQKMSEIAGFLHTVVFIPEDLELVKKGPELRRHFLDREMVQIFSGYHLYLNNYKKALQQRNNLLKQLYYQNKKEVQQEAYLEAMLLPWEEELSKAGAVITYKRWQILEKLNEIACGIHGYLTQQQEVLKLTYESAIEKELFAEIKQGNLSQNQGVKKIAERLRAKYHKNRGQDLQRTTTSVGSHRDDFKIFINDVEARGFGSQGQQRTAALALKLSEMELVKELKGYYPILLLDDVFSELDTDRRVALMQLMFHKAQIFITTTDMKEELEAIKAEHYKKFFINQGSVSSG